MNLEDMNITGILQKLPGIKHLALLQHVQQSLLSQNNL